MRQNHPPPPTRHLQPDSNRCLRHPAAEHPWRTHRMHTRQHCLVVRWRLGDPDFALWFSGRCGAGAVPGRGAAGGNGGAAGRLGPRYGDGVCEQLAGLGWCRWEGYQRTKRTVNLSLCFAPITVPLLNNTHQAKSGNGLEMLDDQAASPSSRTSGNTFCDTAGLSLS